MDKQQLEKCKKIVDEAKKDTEFISYIEKNGMSSEDAVFITVLLYGNMID